MDAKKDINLQTPEFRQFCETFRDFVHAQQLAAQLEQQIFDSLSGLDAGIVEYLEAGGEK